MHTIQSTFSGHVLLIGEVAISGRSQHVLFLDQFTPVIFNTTLTSYKFSFRSYKHSHGSRPIITINRPPILSCPGIATLYFYAPITPWAFIHPFQWISTLKATGESFSTKLYLSHHYTPPIAILPMLSVQAAPPILPITMSLIPLSRKMDDGDLMHIEHMFDLQQYHFPHSQAACAT